MDREPIPTFQDRWDRLTWLLHSYRFWIGTAVVAIVAALAYFRPTLDVPPEVPALIGAFVLVGIPGIPAGFYFGRWLRRYRAVTVYHVNAVDDVIEKWYVPPALWDEKRVDEVDPYPVNDSDDYAVREFDYYEGLDQLVVRGVWMEGAQDDQLFTKKGQVEEIHKFLLDGYEAIAKIRGRISRMAMDVQRRTITALAEAQEKGKMIDQDAVEDVWKQASENIEDELPDTPPKLDPGDDLDGYRTPEHDLSDHENLTEAMDQHEHIQTDE